MWARLRLRCSRCRSRRRRPGRRQVARDDLGRPADFLRSQRRPAGQSPLPLPLGLLRELRIGTRGSVPIDSSGRWKFTDPRGPYAEGAFVAPDRAEGMVVARAGSFLPAPKPRRPLSPRPAKRRSNAPKRWCETTSAPGISPPARAVTLAATGTSNCIRCAGVASANPSRGPSAGPSSPSRLRPLPWQRSDATACDRPPQQPHTAGRIQGLSPPSLHDSRSRPAGVLPPRLAFPRIGVAPGGAQSTR